MVTTPQIPVEEYLRTDYSPDCEYVDGEVLERNVGELDHGWVQRALLLFIAVREKQFGVTILQEQRLQISPRNYGVPDLMILVGGKPKEQIITTPPLVCVEVLSPEDRMSRILKKVADYIAFGVQYVWILDPKRKKAIAYTDRDTIELEHGTLRTENPTIEVPLSEIFD